MKILKAYKNGFGATLGQLRLVTVAYLFLLLPVLLLAFSYHSAFSEAMDSFIMPGRLLKGFDFTAFTELIKIYGDKITASYTYAYWLVVFYFFVSLFVTAGIIFSLKNPERKGNLVSVVTGGSRYFWRFLKLKFYFFIVNLIIVAIIYLPPGMFYFFKYSGTGNERTAFFFFLPVVIFHILVMIFVFTINNYTKFILVFDDTRKVLRSIWAATKFVSGKFFGTYGLAVLLFVVPVIVIILYRNLSGSLQMTSGLMILLAFVVQQFFVWLRVSFKVWFLAGQLEYFKMYHQETEHH